MGSSTALPSASTQACAPNGGRTRTPVHQVGQEPRIRHSRAVAGDRGRQPCPPRQVRLTASTASLAAFASAYAAGLARRPSSASTVRRRRGGSTASENAAARRRTSSPAPVAAARTSARSEAMVSPFTRAWKTSRSPDAEPCTRNRPSGAATRWKLPGRVRASRSRCAGSRSRLASTASRSASNAQRPITASLVAPAEGSGCHKTGLLVALHTISFRLAPRITRTTLQRLRGIRPGQPSSDLIALFLRINRPKWRKRWGDISAQLDNSSVP